MKRAIFLPVLCMFLIITGLGCALKKPGVTILRVDDYFVGEWEVKSVYFFEEDMNLSGKAEVMPDRTFKAYLVQNLSQFSDQRADFSGTWVIDSKTGSLKLEYVFSDCYGKSYDMAILKYKFTYLANAGPRQLILSKTFGSLIRITLQQKSRGR